MLILSAFLFVMWRRDMRRCREGRITHARGLPLFPNKPPLMAGRVDSLHFLIVVERVSSPADRRFHRLLRHTISPAVGDREARAGPRQWRWNCVWTVIPFLLTMVMFSWGASVFFELYRPPDDAMNIYVVGKQWMWKVQHLGGQREINELHIPMGRSVKLTMTSQDVIHDFFVPAFRTKADVLPGRYTNLWFKPTKPGKYHLFCAEYCGTEHSGMIGWVYVMEPAAYEVWLAGSAAGGTLALQRRKIVPELACVNCHRPISPGAVRIWSAFSPARATRRRWDGDGRRELHSRIDSESRRESRRRLSARDAHVPGTGDRRGTPAIDRIHQIVGRASAGRNSRACPSKTVSIYGYGNT